MFDISRMTMRHKITYTVLFVLISLSLASCCRSKEVTGSKGVTSPDISANAFALDIFRQVAAQQKDNLCISPYSIAQALSMAQAGAAGRTAEEMLAVLKLSADPWKNANYFAEANERLMKDGAGASIRIANGLWLQQDYNILPAYTNLITNGFKAGYEVMDFMSDAGRENGRNHINRWTHQITEGYIPELLPPGSLSERTRLVLTNAIFFAGAWKRAFDPDLNLDMPFVRPDGSKDPATFMQMQDTFLYAQLNGFSLLELPFTGDHLVMNVLLPDDWNGVFDLEKTLNVNKLDPWLKKMEPTLVNILLPKWTITYPIDLGQTLIGMGMPLAFGMEADFSGMTGGKDLFISKVLHNSFIEVNEKGAKAAAATAVIMAEKIMVGKPPVYFRADHPFVFIIRDKVSGTILFAGRLAQPA